MSFLNNGIDVVKFNVSLCRHIQFQRRQDRRVARNFKGGGAKVVTKLKKFSCRGGRFDFKLPCWINANQLIIPGSTLYLPTASFCYGIKKLNSVDLGVDLEAPFAVSLHLSGDCQQRFQKSSNISFYGILSLSSISQTSIRHE